MTTRRSFLAITGAATLPSWANGRKALRGIFPIMQTPFTESDKIDFPVLAKEVHFLDRCGVHGMVWPQLASEYMTLSVDERMRGMEAILETAKGIRPAIVIGVQAPAAKQAQEYARRATRLGADAIIALPPQGLENNPEKGVVEYYKAVGEASNLPLFVQAIGKMSLEFIIGMSKEIPTLRYIKDEAGPTLNRITGFRQKAPNLNPMTGSHGKTLFDEMLRGSAGNMPAASWADLYASAWDTFHAGERRQSAEMLARALLFVAEAELYGMEAIKYVLHLRGIFPNWRARRGGAKEQFDDGARAAIRELLEQVKPFLKT